MPNDTFKKKLGKILSVVPFLCMMILIFRFSAQDGPTSGSLSYKVCSFLVSIADHLFSLNLSENAFASTAEGLQFFVRKGAHMTEYFILALSIFLPLTVWFGRKLSPVKRLWVTFPVAVLCASLDEYHQTFVPGRSGSPKDVLVDSIGITLACLAVLLYFHFHKKPAD